MASVAAGKREIGEELGHALIEHGVIVAAGLVSQRRGKPALADAGRPQDEEVGVLLDPLAFGQFAELAAVEAAWRFVIDILDAGLLAQLGVAQARGKTLVVAQRGFAFEQQGEPFGMGESFGFARGFDIDEGLGHAVKAKGVKLVEGRMFVQDRFS